MLRLVSFILLLIGPALAGDLTIHTCGWKLASALSRMEEKGATPFEIIEFRIDRPINYIFGDRKLTPVKLASKLDEKMAIYRYPAIAKKVRSSFVETKLIQDMDPEKLAFMLEPKVIYTYTIQDAKLSITKSKPGYMRDLASKHMLLSADESAGPIRMAGEMWRDEKGLLHFDQGSGTFKPTDDDLIKTEFFFQNHLGIKLSKAVTFVVPEPTVAVASNAQAALNVPAHTITLIVGRQMKSVPRLNKVTLLFTDDKKKDLKYEIRKMSSDSSEIQNFDTIDLKLHSNKTQLKRSIAYDGKEKSKQPNLGIMNNSLIQKYARQQGIDQNQIIMVAKEHNQTEEFGLFRLGKSSSSRHPDFIITLNTSSHTGVAGKIDGKSVTQRSLEIKKSDFNNKSSEKQIIQIKDDLKKRFSLLEKTSSKENFVTILESQK